MNVGLSKVSEVSNNNEDGKNIELMNIIFPSVQNKKQTNCY